MPEEPMILLDSVSRRFGRTMAVRRVSLSLRAGQLVGFVGPSGSGKTTTVRMLCGLLAPTEGRIRVFGHEPIRFTRDDRLRIGYLPQHFLLYPSLSVLANVSFMAGIYGLSPLERRQRIRELLERLELWPQRHRQAANLSGGMQHRLALAATLVHEPELLFLDEPTVGQDPILRRKIWGWLRELERQGRTLFVTTHYVADAELCDQVALMDEGRLIAFDTPASLARRAFGGDVLELTTRSDIYGFLRTLEKMHRVRAVEVKAQDHLILVVDDAGAALPQIIADLQAQGLVPDSLREARPPFDDVFERLIRQYTRREHPS